MAGRHAQVGGVKPVFDIHGKRTGGTSHVGGKRMRLDVSHVHRHCRFIGLVARSGEPVNRRATPVMAAESPIPLTSALKETDNTDKGNSCPARAVSCGPSSMAICDDFLPATVWCGLADSPYAARLRGRNIDGGAIPSPWRTEGRGPIVYRFL